MCGESSPADIVWGAYGVCSSCTASICATVGGFDCGIGHGSCTCRCYPLGSSERSLRGGGGVTTKTRFNAVESCSEAEVQHWAVCIIAGEKSEKIQTLR
jgi:hypothetical protein